VKQAISSKQPEGRSGNIPL